MDNLFAKDKALDSREVAMMVGKRHNDLLRNIREYIKNMENGGERKIAHTDFFTESSYLTDQNKAMPCYLITRKGCEFIANKLTGHKGTVFTAAYINRFHEMESATAPKPISTAKDQGAGEAASLLKVVIKEMHLNNAPQSAIMKYIHTTLEQFSLPVISENEFIAQPRLEQLMLSDKDAV